MGVAESFRRLAGEDTSQVRLSHVPGRTHASFDDPNLVSRAGLVPVMALAERCGLADLAVEHVRIGTKCGVNAHLKIGCLVAGIAAGADSIDDMDALRHGAMGELVRRDPGAIDAGIVPALVHLGQRASAAEGAPGVPGWAERHAPLLPGSDVLAFLDMDSAQERVYGHAKQGAAFGHTKIAGKTLLVRGLNALAVVISTPLAAPVIAATRLRGGSANSARGAASLAAEAISTARQAGCTGQIVFRIDSAYHSAAVLGAIRRAGAYFSVTVPQRRDIRAVIAAIPEDAWIPITYPRAIWDKDQKRLISDAEVAEVPYTAFALKKKGQAITARLMVRRVKDLNRKAPAGQGELFTGWRCHALFTDCPFEMVQAEARHRDHAIIEQVFADCNDGPLAHLPSGSFPPTRPGSPALPSAITCSPPPPPWPARPAPRPRDHHPQPSGQRRRPDRPSRPRPHHYPPARRLAPPDRLRSTS